MEDGDLFLGKFNGPRSTPAAEENGDSESVSTASTPGKRRMATPKTYTPRKRAKTNAGGLITSIESGGKVSLCDYNEFHKLCKFRVDSCVDCVLIECLYE